MHKHNFCLTRIATSTLILLILAAVAIETTAQTPPANADQVEASLTADQDVPSIADQDVPSIADLIADNPINSAPKLKVPEGFAAELLYEVPDEQGSWVSMTIDPKGRLITSDQYGKLYRVTPLENSKIDVQPIELDLGFAQGLLCAFDSLYVVVNGQGKDKLSALYRVRDTDNDDQYDDAQLLRKFNFGGEHGPHAVILSPDKKSLFVCAGNHTKLPELESSRVPRNWDEDQLLTRLPDAGGHAAGKMAPGGWICKTDPEGKSFELVSSGYRNQYDIAFDPNGELFTYDADMEWDIGLPWYRPTRVCHATSGSEFGWRNGTGKWPAYYPDSVPGVVDIGPGSPTGIAFGTGAKFPAKYQNALFIADWSYGVIYSVTLTPSGATYAGTFERFCAAPALPVTDLVINTTDGAMYFLIGGRRTQSALYRISYHGAESVAPATYPQPDSLVATRREIEAFHLPDSNSDLNSNLDQIWNYLSHDDRAIRYAARVAVEHQPVADWSARAVAETDPQATLQSIVALARCGTPEHQPAALTALERLNWDPLSKSQRLDLLRAYGLVLIRLGRTESAKQSIHKLAALYPTGDESIDIELAKLLIAADTPDITELVLTQMVGNPTAEPTVSAGQAAEQLKPNRKPSRHELSSTQEQQIAYALMLTDAKSGWTIEQRRRYFQWFLDAAEMQGGRSLNGYLQNIRNAMVEKLTDGEKAELAAVLKERPEKVDPYAELNARQFVKNWTLDDLMPMDEEDLIDRDLEKGKKMFAVAACYKCHRIAGQGGVVGPDLTPAGHRFSTHDLLETIVDPNKAISDQYVATIFQMLDGKLVTGRVANLRESEYLVQEDMARPGKLTKVKVDDIDETVPSKISMMPAGLLNNLSREEILDLVAYLKSTAE